jgi:hypothetical protein
MIAMTGIQQFQQHPHVSLSLQSWDDTPSPLELAVVVVKHFEHCLGHPQEVDGFIRVVIESTTHVMAREKIEAPCHILPEIQAVTGNRSVWIIINQADLDTYWDIFQDKIHNDERFRATSAIYSNKREESHAGLCPSSSWCM